MQITPTANVTMKFLVAVWMSSGFIHDNKFIIVSVDSNSPWRCVFHLDRVIECSLSVGRSSAFRHIVCGPMIGAGHLIFILGQAKRIDPLSRVGCILIDADATLQPNRILANEPPTARIVVPILVVMQPRLLAATANLSAFAISCSDVRRIHRRSGIAW